MPNAPNASPRRPIVGITATVDHDGRPDLAPTYIAAVRAAGLEPIVLTARDSRSASETLNALDALLLSGGEDIEPTHYGEAPHREAGPFVPARDAWELALAREAASRRLPTLAICRGAQLLNVALGGTLVQHLGDDARGARHDRADVAEQRVHGLVVDGQSTLATILGAPPLDVNSYHHQAIRDVAPALDAAAWSDDGVIEAVVARDAAWHALGVQWHPEDLANDADQRGLFTWLADACRPPTA